MKENKEIFAKVFYTPVNEPQNIRSIEVTSEKDYMQIENFIKGNTKKKRNPNLLDYESSGIKSSITDDFLKKSFIEVTEEDCKKLFEYFSMRMYTRSKESIRYWSVVVNDEFIFVYHFSPEKGFTFEENKIREFIKYLDKSTLLRFLFISQKKKVLEYIDSEKVDIDKKSDDKRMICAYEKQCSKGFQELLAGQPVYESKGDLKIRVKYSESTDVIIETDVDDIESINSNISIDFDEMNATVELKNAPIMEIEIAGKKYKAVENDSEIIRYRIKYEQLKIRRILEDVQWLIKENSQQEEIEEDAKKMGAEGKIIIKPDSKFNEKDTIFIVGGQTTKHEKIVDNLAELIRNDLSISFVEISHFNQKYTHLDVGGFSLFCKVDDIEQAKKLAKIFTEIIFKIKSLDTLYRIVSYSGLIAVIKYAHSKNFREIVYKSSITALQCIFFSLYKKSTAVDLKEVDELGIEFKAGIRNDGNGFFDPSPKKFAKKIVKKSNNKNLDIISYFIGINEDTRDFSPIPLNRVRNEFHSELRKHLESNGLDVIVSESIPLNGKKALLLIVVKKQKVENLDV